MRATLSRRWDAPKGRYWLVPSLLAVFAIGLAFVMAEVDRYIEGSPGGFLGPLYGGTPESARAILSTIAMRR
jgi:uncharacterized membrane protein